MLAWVARAVLRCSGLGKVEIWAGRGGEGREVREGGGEGVCVFLHSIPGCRCHLTAVDQSPSQCRSAILGYDCAHVCVCVK